MLRHIAMIVLLFTAIVFSNDVISPQKKLNLVLGLNAHNDINSNWDKENVYYPSVGFELTTPLFYKYVRGGLGVEYSFKNQFANDYTHSYLVNVSDDVPLFEAQHVTATVSDRSGVVGRLYLFSGVYLKKFIFGSTVTYEVDFLRETSTFVTRDIATMEVIFKSEKPNKSMTFKQQFIPSVFAGFYHKRFFMKCHFAPDKSLGLSAGWTLGQKESKKTYR